MIETSVLFAHFLNWNEYGVPALSITLLGIISGASKRAISRMVVTFVALGYGIVRPSLGEDMNRVLYLGGAYFVLSFIYALCEGVPSANKVLGGPDFDILSLVVFMLAGIDTTFYIWIISSINNLLVTLASRRQAVKYLLYRNFRSVLYVSIFFTVVWALYGSIIMMNDGTGEEGNWKDKWTIDALWELTYLAIFIAIGILWAPSKNSQRYAMNIELAQLEDDAEWNDPLDNTNSAGLGGGGGGVASTKNFEKDSLLEKQVDGEYGGRLRDEEDPFQGMGALDPSMAIQKKA